jgi:hypothetical protein
VDVAGRYDTEMIEENCSNYFFFARVKIEIKQSNKKIHVDFVSLVQIAKKLHYLLSHLTLSIV